MTGGLWSGPKAKVLGGLAVLGAFGSWGAFPIYFKAVGHVPAVEILAHRFLWTTVVLAAALTLLGRWPQARRAVGDRRIMLALLASGVVLSINWVIFIWAVVDGRVVDTSLGYFGAPLVYVVLGVLVLKETMTGWQWAAVALAAAGVVNMVVAAGTVPWVSLSLALAWSAYGLLRKMIPVDAIDGLFVETLLLTPPAIVYILWVTAHGAGHVAAGDFATDGLILASGILTAVPLCCFAFAARRVKLATLGVFQYITPSLTFGLGVFLYNEPFGTARQVTFGLIWLALAVYTLDAVRTGRKRAG